MSLKKGPWTELENELLKAWRAEGCINRASRSSVQSNN
jgi:hypothetical protein